MEPKFNPSDPKYKEVKDLPRAFKDDYIDTEDGKGFVRKTADEYDQWAERAADHNIRVGKTEGLSAIDVLHKEATADSRNIEKAKERIIGARFEKPFNGTFYLPSGLYNAVKGYEIGALSRSFFMDLADNGVPFKTREAIPEELLNDEEFLLNLAEKTRTDFTWIELSERLEKDNNFKLKLLERGAHFGLNLNTARYERDIAVIEEYLKDKNSEEVFSYLMDLLAPKKYDIAGRSKVFLQNLCTLALAKFKNDEIFENAVSAFQETYHLKKTLRY